MIHPLLLSLLACAPPSEADYASTRGSRVEVFFNDPGSRVQNIWQPDVVDVMVEMIDGGGGRPAARATAPAPASSDSPAPPKGAAEPGKGQRVMVQPRQRARHHAAVSHVVYGDFATRSVQYHTNEHTLIARYVWTFS